MEKEKLTLKELAGYLPYRLKISINNNVTELNCINGESSVCSQPQVRGFKYCSYDDFKPILRPLSDLTKEITHNGETFVPIKYLTEKIFMCELPWFEIMPSLDIYTQGEDFCISFYDLKSMFQKLYEWHFDIHGLIERGLAININDLPNGR